MLETVRTVCRLCLSEEGLMLPIFRNENPKDGPAFRLKVMSCAEIQIFADDGLPTNVCHMCVHQVEKSFQFKSMCERSDATLRIQLQAEKLERKNPPSLEQFDIKNGWSEHSIPMTDAKSSSSNYVSTDQEFYLDKKLNTQVPSCFACAAIFETYDQLLDHLTSIHPQITSFICNTCDTSFLSLKEFTDHINEKHSLSCTHCDQVFKHQKNLDYHIKIHLEAKHVCKFCKEAFVELSEKKKHELKHLERLCGYCSSEFPTKELCDAHLKNCSPNFPCKFCDSSFGLKKDLIEHVASSHDETSLPKCNICHKIFNNWDDVQRHSCESQTQAENLQCKTCQASFTSLTLLESHMTTEHNAELLNCRFCTKSFSLKSSLRRHEKSHSGLKPYQCKFCPRKFKDNSTCIVHMRTHTGEHPFRCQECNKDFKQLANLKMHTYRHHKKNKPVTTEGTSEVITEPPADYDNLYQNSVLENYSIEATRVYQQLDLGIPPTYEHGVDIS